MTEQQLLEAIVDLAHVYGYRAAHFRPALTGRGWRTPVSADGKGFPDLVIARAGRVIFAELKADAGKVSEDQRLWLAATGGVVWRPKDWDDGTILRVLAARVQISDGTAKQASEVGPVGRVGDGRPTLPTADGGLVHANQLRDLHLGETSGTPKVS